MHFSAHEIRSFISGCASIEETARGCRFLRFTPAQMADYRDPDSYTPPEKKFIPKSFASSGLVLEVETDAEVLTLDCDVESGSSRLFYDFDFYTDGVMTGHFSRDDFHLEPSPAIRFALDGKRHQYRLFFPQLASVIVRSLDLRNASVAEIFQKKGTMIAFGDSITQGYDARHPSFCYPHAVADHFGLELVNKAVGGDVFRPTLLKEPDPVMPRFITVAYGANDWMHLRKDEFQRNTTKFFARLKALYPNVPFAVILPIWNGFVTEATPVGTFQEMRSFIREKAEDSGAIRIVDGWSLTPHLAEFYSPDLLHPVDAGFLCYGADALRQLSGIDPEVCCRAGQE